MKTGFLKCQKLGISHDMNMRSLFKVFDLMVQNSVGGFKIMGLGPIIR